MQFSRIMQRQPKTLPARDCVANTLILHPVEYFMIVIGFAAPATLDELKWNWNIINVVAMLEYQCAPLEEDGCLHRHGSIKRLCSTHHNAVLRHLAFYRWEGSEEPFPYQ